MRLFVKLAIALSVVLSMTVNGMAMSPSTPVDTGRVDLAAVALAPGDVPPGYFDEYSEWAVPQDSVAGAIGADTPEGMQQLYQSFYFNPAENSMIHVFLLEFTNADQAASATPIIDDVIRPPLPDGTTTEPVRTTGLTVEDQSLSLTTVTFDTWAAGGPRVDVEVASFQSDNLLAGISVERYTDPPAEGTPVAVSASASPAASNPASQNLAIAMATVLADRIATERAGSDPAGVDSSLMHRILPIEGLVVNPLPIFGGYKAGIDMLRCGVCGEENSLVQFENSALDGVARGIVVGPLVEGEPQPPFVVVGIIPFATPGDAAAALEAMRASPNDRPTSIPIPRGTRTIAADPVIPGTDAALAFTAVFDAEQEGASADSAGVTYVTGNLLVTIDVMGGMTGETALSAATDLATQQAACLANDGTCESVKVPAEFQVLE